MGARPSPGFAAAERARRLHEPVPRVVTIFYEVPSEYEALTQTCGLVDRSERGKLALTGADAKEFLNGQVTQDITQLTPGHGAYAALLTNKGKMLADLRVLDTGDALLLDTERAGLQELFNAIRRFSVGYDVTLHKRTLEYGQLSLIGPEADALARKAGFSVPGPAEHDHVNGVVRTDLGLDLFAPTGEVGALSQGLADAGAVPVSEQSAETLRVERGRPRYGVDLDDSVIPQEAGLNERAVSFTKGCYVGQETVARLYYRGKPNRRLCGLKLSEPAPAGTEFSYEERVVAALSSVADSPRFGPVGLALVRRNAPVGARLDSGSGVAAEVVELPFT
ncbi:MAG: folate-binding protein YgfZ [Solirubrobacterales bacterium]|nr:folate-binding protein YgfZ [Solirubrobacterales bacterium]